MAVTNGYVSLPEFKRYLPLHDAIDDGEIEGAINAASRWVDQYCQRHFWKTAVGTARVFEPPHDRRLLRFGSFNDAVSITAVKSDEDGDGTFETTWASTDYELLPLTPTSAPEQRPYTQLRSTGSAQWFPWLACTGRLARIEITGQWGWPEIPIAVHQACLIQASRIFKRRNSPEGVTGWGSDYGPIRVTVRADPDVTAMLAPYRLYQVLVA